ncbi:metallophosphoesterase [Bacillus cereus]|nr:metallophosphoesterase [Bacillus cereus]
MKNQQITSNFIDSGLIQSIVITSDPQYPWTPCTDGYDWPDGNIDGTHCKTPVAKTCTAYDKDSENLINEQYDSINSYANTVGKDKISVIINGDITNYGHGNQWNKMLSIFKTQFYNKNITYYYGLGNHDMLNNQKRKGSEGCANDGCFRDSIYHMYGKDHNSRDQPNVPYEYSYEVKPIGSNSRRGSFSYYFDCRNILCIQLNNFPTMPDHYSDGDKLHFTTKNVISWLKNILDNRKGPVIINLHSPDNSWRDRGGDGEPENMMANQQFVNFINEYNNIVAIFAGHYHYTTGRYPSRYGFKAPMFLSGSAMFKSYLILEQYNNRLEIYLVCGNNWSKKTLIDTINTLSIDNKEYFSSSQSFITLKDLEKITQQVHSLFSSTSFTELTSTVSSYQIDQVAMKVNALSIEFFGKERTSLRKLVNKAKQLMRARNLLVGGDFETLDTWLLGNGANIANNSALFKNNYLFLSANDTSDLSSYAYQKIDESKLKQYTRYKVSGFIGHSQYLELSLSHYGNEINKLLNIPYAEEIPISSDSNPNYRVPNPCGGNSNQPDFRFFSYNINIGELHLELNAGIELGLRVSPNGFATISNLEIVEERPLNETEIQKVRKKEPKWKILFEKEHTQTHIFLESITNQINAFFKNADLNDEILPHITYQELYNIVLPKLSTLLKLRQWFKKDNEGKSYMILQPLKEALERVFMHVEKQNLIHNNDFTNNLTAWFIEGDAQIITLENGNFALQLSNWDSSVSQAVDILDFDEENDYQLLIRAKGKGTVTIEHGEELETIEIPSNSDFYFHKSEPFSFQSASFVLQLQSENSEFIVEYVGIIEVPKKNE